MKDWIHYTELTKDHEPKIGGLISVDTRDFHAISGDEADKMPKLPKLRGKGIEYLSLDQIKERLSDWEEKSGGKKRWRHIQDNVSGWYKYIRIYRFEQGYVWCDNYHNYRSSQNLEDHVQLKDPYGE